MNGSSFSLPLCGAGGVLLSAVVLAPSLWAISVESEFVPGTPADASQAAITDLSALLALPDLAYVEMRGIALNADMQADIATLQAAGVFVRHD